MRRRRPPQKVDSLSYIRPVPETAVLTPTPTGYQLAWKPEAQTITISVRDLADSAVHWQNVKTVTNAQSTELTLPFTAVRPLFRLSFSGREADGRYLDVAERFVSLSGTVNFRDIGGYETENGRFVRWGKLYRAGLLANLTDADQRLLNQLGIRTICDVRSPEEAKRRPDRIDLLEQVQHLNLHVESVDRFSRLRALFTVLFRRDQLFDVLHHGYLEVVLEQNPHVAREIFRRLARPERLPTLIHCTAGKDRTGVMTALLLTVLGVPRETIIADYTLSNQFYDYFRESLKPDVQFLTRFGVTIDDLWPFLVVDGQTLRKTFHSIEERYGSVERYLTQKAGVETAVLDQVRDNLLT